jgi:outer membrane lipoprotein SlyB
MGGSYYFLFVKEVDPEPFLGLLDPTIVYGFGVFAVAAVGAGAGTLAGAAIWRSMQKK